MSSTRESIDTSKLDASRAKDELSLRILTLAHKLYPAQVRLRRKLHQRPELSNEETETTSLLSRELSRLGLKLNTYGLPTGVVAELKGNHPGPTIAVRSDIDALPVLEKSGLPFSSKIPGKMHACGHDAHMATVMTTAALLAKIPDEIHGTVRFIFQPAEETPPGGARPLIAAGALENPRVCAILGLHVDPRVPVGKIGLRDGPTMASVNDFDITIEGSSGHAARPHDSIDAIAITGDVISALQKIVSRRVDPLHPVVLTVGRIAGGVARNVIANKVTMQVTLRTLEAADASRLLGLIKRTVSGICRAQGAKGKIEILASYPTLANDARINEIFRRSYTRLFGPGKVVKTDQVLGGEDFACYLEVVPGAMTRLGVRNPAIGATANWHSDKFIIDERSLYYGAALLAHTVVSGLREMAPPELSLSEKPSARKHRQRKQKPSPGRR